MTDNKLNNKLIERNKKNKMDTNKLTYTAIDSKPAK